MTRRLCLFVFACVHPEKLKFSLFSCVNIFGRKQNRLHSLSVTSRPPNTTQHAKPAQQGTASPPRERAAAGPARPGARRTARCFHPCARAPQPGPA